jgi:hypothetical protein
VSNRPIEYDHWKTDLSLPAYAAHCGYKLDSRKSTTTYTVMRKASKKVIIRRGAKKSYWIFSEPNSGLQGTILDLAAQHLDVSLRDARGWAAVCAELRAFAGAPPRTRFELYEQPAAPPFDRQAVVRAWSAASSRSAARYLTEVRALSRLTLDDERFQARWREDSQGRFLFPHSDTEGLCGFERKGANHTGFAKGGRRGLFCSLAKACDTRIGFADATLDLMSYHELCPSPSTRYMSTGGELSDRQLCLVARALLKMPAGSTVLSLFDNDPAGDRMTAQLEVLVSAISFCAVLAGVPHPGLVLVREVPPTGKDWNAHLQQTRQRLKPAGPQRP